MLSMLMNPGITLHDGDDECNGKKAATVTKGIRYCRTPRVRVRLL